MKQFLVFYQEGEKIEEAVTFEISDTEIIVKQYGEIMETLPKVVYQ